MRRVLSALHHSVNAGSKSSACPRRTTLPPAIACCSSGLARGASISPRITGEASTLDVLYSAVLRRTPYSGSSTSENACSRHPSVNSAAAIEPPSSRDYFPFPRGTFSLPNGKPAGTPRRNGEVHREDREGHSAAAGGSGGGTDEKWTEEDFKQRVRERLDRIEQHLDRIDQRLDRIEGHGGGPSGGRSEGRGRRRRGG